ncbi:hypothetical protein BBP40_010353 [Aspergillus hancockii]|nr:hypothetical protein BBP40_010353 [Aspergillus hancockii]
MSTTVKGPLCTQSSLKTDLLKLGLKPGDTILLHSSLSSIGWIPGGAETLLKVLLSILTPTGTLVVPTHTGDNSDPADWHHPPVPEEWWPTIRATMPAYDPRITRTRGMGVLPEMLRRWPGALRSAHPQTSFAAVGAKAELITGDHALDCKMGERSPLARLEGIGARVLLLGVGFERCSAFHLAEYRIPGRRVGEEGFAAFVRGQRQWVVVRDVSVDDGDFGEIGADLEEKGVNIRVLVIEENIIDPYIGVYDAEAVEMVQSTGDITVPFDSGETVELVSADKGR